LTPPRYQDVFGETLLELAEKNEKIVGITPAMPTGCSLNLMMQKMPDRAFDVGIAEQHAVTFAAGMAIQGLIPYCNLYSSFAQRAYDQIVHDVALQNLHVVFCFDRAGLVGNDGATHHGSFDVSYLRCIPNMVIAAPMDDIELRNMLYSAQLEHNKFPIVIRYPRGRGVNLDWKKTFEEIPFGKAELIKKGKKIAILSFGTPGLVVKMALEELNKQNIQPSHYNMRFAKPLDEKCLHEICKNYETLVSIEDGVVAGGFGSAVLEFMAENNYKNSLIRLGIPDRFVEHGTQAELIAECKYDKDSIIATIVKNY
ncbi:MAG: 1-deoxy-D-xylulose-5-phosphate synthase, partial [Bacteroidales bacterium]|nr:1-deoxy-D-xylulose-5-phosphate synthase [Bacteroidales bacterium]